MLLPDRAGALAGLRSLFLLWCGYKVNDGFLRSLASGGCGENLTLLTLGCESLLVCIFIPPCLLEWRSCGCDSWSFLLLFFPMWHFADLKEGFTDEGLRALASAGCGTNLTSLTLHCEGCACFRVVWMAVFFDFFSPHTLRAGSGSDRQRSVCACRSRLRQAIDVAASFQ